MELKLNGITKSYTKGKKRRNALEDFTFTFNEGVYGLLGPNGAGKSTLINIIAGIIGRDSGDIGFQDGGSGDYISHLGFMPQGIDFYRNFTALDYIKYIMTLKRYSPADPDGYATEILTKVNLQNDARKKIGAFSGGMKQRLGIAQAIVGEPRILIFDEPTAGLDAKERIRFRNVISSLGTDKIVLLATHIVTDIAYVAKTVILMDNGRIIETGPQEKLCDTVKGKVWECHVQNSEVMDYMGRLRVSNVHNNGTDYTLRIISEERPDENAVLCEPSLEDVCIYHFGDM
ncbi:MAG: ATP-binding cassette domain-containing protein [Oscillospiraceae bacterium]|nr:ATP-binding cassette domain-containing protein [Oscillospiraceae bacterium]